MANNPKAIENLKPFKQGEDERRHMQGRPQKLITQMKEIGYTKSQVEDTMLSMLSLSRKELEKQLEGKPVLQLRATYGEELPPGLNSYGNYFFVGTGTNYKPGTEKHISVNVVPGPDGKLYVKENDTWRKI